MKSDPTFQTFRTIKTTVAISFAVYGAVVLLAGYGAAHHGWCAMHRCSFVAWGFARARLPRKQKTRGRKV